MVKKILIVFAVLLAALLAYAATRPDTFHVERQATMQAAPERIFAKIQDFHEWDQWSPWEKLDPKMKKTFTGAPAGPGSNYAWEGENGVGKGSMALVAAEIPTQVRIKLTFLEPFAAQNDVLFKLQPQGAGTSVTWSMDGKNNFVARIFSIFMDMDAMIGKDFEAGLANLKAVAEKP